MCVCIGWMFHAYMEKVVRIQSSVEVAFYVYTITPHTHGYCANIWAKSWQQNEVNDKQLRFPCWTFHAVSLSTPPVRTIHNSNRPNERQFSKIIQIEESYPSLDAMTITTELHMLTIVKHNKCIALIKCFPCLASVFSLVWSSIPLNV